MTTLLGRLLTTTAPESTSLPQPPSLPAGPAGPLAYRTLLEQFVSCRTTLHNLQQRTTALGQHLTISDIATHLTGTTELPNALHNVLADAINQRLTELAEPPTVLHRPCPNHLL